jgi:hypothetical protein
MNREMNLVSVLLVAFMGMVLAAGLASCGKKDGGTASGGSKSGAVAVAPKRESNGQYRIGSKVQVYDVYFKPTGAYFTYSPGKLTNLDYDNTVILNFGPPYIDAALFFGKRSNNDSIGFVRSCIDKSIEWTATAKQNNVHSLAKELSFDEYNVENTQAAYGLNQPDYRRHESVYLMFNFFIGDLDETGKEETWLIMRYLNRDDVLRRSQGHFFCFRENDFARLKEMFSESYLAEIDKHEAAWQESHAEQGALFE